MPNQSEQIPKQEIKNEKDYEKSPQAKRDRFQSLVGDFSELIPRKSIPINEHDYAGIDGDAFLSNVKEIRTLVEKFDREIDIGFTKFGSSLYWVSEVLSHVETDVYLAGKETDKENRNQRLRNALDELLHIRKHFLNMLDGMNAVLGD